MSFGHLRKGAVRPVENDSAFLLDRHRRGVPNRGRMARYTQSDEVDMVIVGCGAGGGVLAQRLARLGWRVVVLERGPFWDPTPTGCPMRRAQPISTGMTCESSAAEIRSSLARTTRATASAGR